jgi:transcriptional regulator with XRE-family HTH domain
MAETTTIAERIRDEREWLGFTRAQVAEKLHRTEATIDAFEEGAMEPTDEELAALADLFGLAPERLRGEPLAEDASMAILCGSKSVTAEDRYQVMRFAEYLRHAGPAPTIVPDAPRRRPMSEIKMPASSGERRAATAPDYASFECSSCNLRRIVWRAWHLRLGSGPCPLCGSESNAPASSPVSAATGEDGEAQEGPR